MLGIALAVSIAELLRLQKQYKVKASLSFIVSSVLGTWLGAKILYLLSGPLALTEILNFSFLFGGGFVFYGGLIGLMLTQFIYLQLARKDRSWLLVSISILAVIKGHIIGRLGCFLTGCCFGRACDLPGISHHPTQLYEMVLLIILYSFLRFKTSILKVLPLYLIIYGVFRFLIEFLRADTIRGIYFGLSTSQYISLLLIPLGVMLLWRHCSNKDNSKS